MRTSGSPDGPNQGLESVGGAGAADPRSPCEPGAADALQRLGVEEAHLRLRQVTRGQQREREPGRSGADHGQTQRRGLAVEGGVEGIGHRRGGMSGGVWSLGHDVDPGKLVPAASGGRLRTTIAPALSPWLGGIAAACASAHRRAKARDRATAAGHTATSLRCPAPGKVRSDCASDAV